jgi:hypothetical protein
MGDFLGDPHRILGTRAPCKHVPGTTAHGAVKASDTFFIVSWV